MLFNFGNFDTTLFLVVSALEFNHHFLEITEFDDDVDFNSLLTEGEQNIMIFSGKMET